MTAAQLGYAFGVFFAAGGAGYILLAILWALRVYKRWPRGCYVAACLLVIVLGLSAASVSNSTNEVVITMIACLAAAGFMAWRGKLFAQTA